MPGVCKVEVHGALGDPLDRMPWSFGFHARFSDPVLTPTASDVDDLLEATELWFAVADAGVPPIIDRLSTSIASSHFRGQVIATPTPQPRVRVGGNQGIDSEPALPPQCAVVATKRTAVAAKSGLGRMYLPPCPQNRVNQSGVMNVTYATELEASVQRLIDRVAGAGASNAWRLCVRSTTLGTTQDVTNLQLGRRIDTQRRRLNGETAYVG